MIPERWLRELPARPASGVQVARGEGACVWDDEQKRYLDLASGAVAPLGHAHPAVQAAVSQQLARLSGAHRSFEFDARDELVDALSAVVPEPLSHVTFATSSAAARRRALSYARHATGRPRAVATEGIGAAGAAIEHVPYDDLGAIERALDERTAAVVVEAIQARADVRVPAAGYLATVAAMCGEVGALLIVDEEHTAMRTGAPLACTAAGVVPDLLIMGRGLASGLPIGITVTRPEIARRVQGHAQQSAAAATPLVCAAAAATIAAAADPALQAHAGLVGGHLLTRLRALRLAEIRDVRGQGMVLAIAMRHNPLATVRHLREHGILVAPARHDRMRLYPPLILEKRQADLFVESFAAAVLALRRRASAAGEASVELPGTAARPVRRDAR